MTKDYERKIKIDFLTKFEILEQVFKVKSKRFELNYQVCCILIGLKLEKIKHANTCKIKC